MNLDYPAIRTTALWVLVGIAVIGVVLAIVIKKIIGKIITLVLAAVLVFAGWQQRSAVINSVTGTANGVKSDVCSNHPKFFGIQVSIPGC